ncbi:hypothetical protein GCM10022223_16800 [Kineosporia mesophila]|uniref:Aminotransferase n=1 Tax=Kineosporia mesophila TaxID=566012 RepID=A0ABP6ZAT1_9ACTN|nr:aminotransferase class III-fold pyridoxal phosphate-dependent enzyme [Kineosporia mesophila]
MTSTPTTQAPTARNELDRALAITSSRTWDADRRMPLVPDRGQGAHFWDSSGQEYIDLTSCTGAAPLGMGHAPVLDAVIDEMRRSGGVLPGVMSSLRTDVAQDLCSIFPCAQRALFFRTGSCATSGAVRLARVHTGRDLILTSGFHGWHDWQLQYKGTPDVVGRDAGVVDFGYDVERLRTLLEDHPGRVAAVFVTPESTCMPLADLFTMQDLARSHGALFALDEVMTGFRFVNGGLHGALGLTPDLITVSKGLCNGMALSAVLGARSVLEAHEKTYLGNTFMREVAPFAGARVSVDIQRNGATQTIIDHVSRLVPGINAVLARHGLAARALSAAGIFHVLFEDDDLGQRFYTELRRRGVHAEFGGAHLVSAALTPEDIDQALLAFDEVAATFAGPSARSISAGAFARFAEDAFRVTPRVAARWWEQLGPRLDTATPDAGAALVGRSA